MPTCFGGGGASVSDGDIDGSVSNGDLADGSDDTHDGDGGGGDGEAIVTAAAHHWAGQWMPPAAAVAAAAAAGATHGARHPGRCWQTPQGDGRDTNAPSSPIWSRRSKERRARCSGERHVPGHSDGVRSQVVRPPSPPRARWRLP